MLGYYKIGKLWKKTKEWSRREGGEKRIILLKRINMKMMKIIIIIIIWTWTWTWTWIILI